MILNFGDGFFLRQARAEDHAALCEVCLKTGDAGEDATAREDDLELMGMIYAVPYQVLEPEFAFAIEGSSGVCGYLFGVPDTRAFNERLAAEWYPKLQARVADPGPDPSRWRGSDWARHMIHHPNLAVPEPLKAYLSHGHIDLLPEARGRGIGSRCMEYLQGRLAETGSIGMYLDVHPRNTKAQAFYRGLGFEVVRGERLSQGSVFMGKRFA